MKPKIETDSEKITQAIEKALEEEALKDLQEQNGQSSPTTTKDNEVRFDHPNRRQELADAVKSSEQRLQSRGKKRR